LGAGQASEKAAREFFESVVSRKERSSLRHARAIAGLDEEIALLRLKLRALAANGRSAKKGTKSEGTDHGKANAGVDVEADEARIRDFVLLVRGMDTLARLCSVRYRLSQQSREGLADSMAAVLQGVRSELGIGEDDAEGA
jgi:hypothetical protein